MDHEIGHLGTCLSRLPASSTGPLGGENSPPFFHKLPYPRNFNGSFASADKKLGEVLK
jgi:hypothetical protein